VLREFDLLRVLSYPGVTPCGRPRASRWLDRDTVVLSSHGRGYGTGSGYARTVAFVGRGPTVAAPVIFETHADAAVWA